MKNWQAFKTHHKNQTHAAIARRWSLTENGLKLGSKSSGRAVVYCGACGAPVVDSAAGRARHALRGQKCAQAVSKSKGGI